MATFTRTTRSTGFGMLPKNRARAQARQAGTAPAETGKHRGGPCPAVCLATLTGWSYARADVYLRRVAGYTGAGMLACEIEPVFTQVLGQPWLRIGEKAISVAAAVHLLAAEHGPVDGAIWCAGHVMPIRRGRLLNAAGCEHKTVRGVLLWRIDEVHHG